MMVFGASGSARAQQADKQDDGKELLTLSNWWRAQALANLVDEDRAVIRQTIRHKNGWQEVYSFPNPLIHTIVKHRFAYPADAVATFQAFIELLLSNSGLRSQAKRSGITVDGLEWEIEQIWESVRGGFYA